MTDHIDSVLPPHMARRDWPLAGVTLLLVEDSRFASEAVRLLCLRSGARVRRADCLASARRHLAAYRPSVVLVDLGLPDGEGCDLIETLAAMPAPRPAIVGTSGLDGAAPTAFAAGADGFLAKPVELLATFQETLLSVLPPEVVPKGPRALPDVRVAPDGIAYLDDLAYAADFLSSEVRDGELVYIARFLSGLAEVARDAGLARAADEVLKAHATRQPINTALARLGAVVQDKLVARTV